MSESTRIDTDGEVPEIRGFRIVRDLGSGGMGRLFYAIQESLSRPVVIKIAHQKGAKPEPEVIERFEREALLQAKGSHPNVVGIIDRGTVDDRLYIVMEYVAGQDLRARLSSELPMSIAEAREVLSSMGQAVASLHQKSIVHRDLKPENILVGDDGKVRIADFGIAVSSDQIDDLSESEKSLGTYDYMAPEQKHRLGVDERADQYSLAIIAYELLTSRRPKRVVSPPSEHNVKLSERVDRAILRALQFDPSDRFADVSAFAESLDQALEECVASPRQIATTDTKTVSTTDLATTSGSGAKRVSANRQLVAVLGLMIVATGIALFVFRQTGDTASAPSDGLDSNPLPGSYDASVGLYVEQTAALPYRFQRGVLQILLVRTLRDSHWTIPKATQDQFRTRDDVAIQEARTEAGVVGFVRDAPIGQYRYTRSGKDYRVTVIPVLVQDQLSEWPDQGRRAQQWCTKERALEEAGSSGLRDLIREFSPPNPT